jgi:hypothetical protein
MKKFLYVLSFCALFLLMSMAHAQEANSGSISQSQTKVNAQQGNDQSTSAALNLTQNSNDSGHMHYSGDYTVHANPGAVLQGPGMGYSNWNCANGAAAGGSTFWASFSWSGSKESQACNFRANAALHAQIDATPRAGQAAHNSAAMADYVTCTTGGKKLLQACIKLGLVINADTPAETTESEWQACHATLRMLVICKQNHMISQSDEPVLGGASGAPE